MQPPLLGLYEHYRVRELEEEEDRREEEENQWERHNHNLCQARQTDSLPQRIVTSL